MTIKQFKAKYSGSLLGVWWAVFAPLILAASINFIFTKVFTINMPHYTLFVLSGIMPWLFFSNTLMEAVHSFIVNASISKQVIFPRELIPLSCVLANFLNFSLGFLFILFLFVILKFQVAKVLIFLIFPMALQLLFVIGLSLVLSCWNAFYRDVSNFLSIFLMIWFWITPIFYSSSMLAFPYRWICLVNPMTYYVMSYQQILFEAKIPSFSILFISFLFSFLFLAVGYLSFLKIESGLLKRI